MLHAALNVKMYKVWTLDRALYRLMAQHFMIFPVVAVCLGHPVCVFGAPSLTTLTYTQVIKTKRRRNHLNVNESEALG